MKLNLSPSRIGLYFYYQCPRYLIFSAMTKESKKQHSVPTDYLIKSPVTKAILEGGYDWEEKVIKRRIKDRVHLAEIEEKKKIRDRTFGEDETLEVLNNLEEDQYIYQAQLSAPESFYNKFNIDPEIVDFRISKPDLIYCRGENGNKIFEIIDLKASDHLKTSHKIQVSMYSLMLDHVLNAQQISGKTNLELGGVWLYEADQPEYFSIPSIIPHIEEFLAKDLHEFLKTDPQKLPWHLYSRCETCEFFDYCKEKAHSIKSVSLIPYLSVYSRKYLRTISNPCETLTDFDKILKSKKADELLSNSAVFSGKVERYKLQTQALINSELYLLGGSSIMMPKGENVRIIITLEKEPISGKLYALGYLRYGGTKIFEKGFEREIYIAENIKDCENIRRKFITRLLEIMTEIHNYNVDLDWEKQQSLQTYVYDSLEYQLFNDMLLDALTDAKIAKAVVTLLFYFQSEVLFQSDEHPADSTNFPLIMITEAIKQLFAVPIYTAFNLESVYNVFKPERSIYDYKKSDYFHFEYSNALKPNAIFSVWHEGKKENTESIRKELQKRLSAKNDIINGIREKAVNPETGNSILFAWPEKFLFPEPDRYSSPILSKLAFITKYEKILEFLGIKSQRSLPLYERIKNGICFILKADGDDANTFTTESSEFDYLLEDGFFWLLSEHNEDGDRNQMAYMDYIYKDAFWAPKNSRIYLAVVENISAYTKNKIRLTLDLKKGASSPRILKGSEYLLQTKFTDFNNSKVLSNLRSIEEYDKNKLVNLLQDPASYLSKLAVAKNIKETADSLLHKARFTESQKNAFHHFVDYNLTLVWGPPGTGKTHFIALSLLILQQTFQKLNQPCHIFISAFTHAAIENCLNKIIELNQIHKIWTESDFNVYKLDQVKGEKFKDIPYFGNNELSNQLASVDRCIVGGTIYALHKAMKYSDIEFDIVVLDEASQNKVPDALMALGTLKKKGRYLIVGDDKQLPPIVNGKYPSDDTDLIKLHKSIFEVIKNRDDKGKITCQLLENFRMNSSLCIFPSEYIYGPKYHSYDNKIANRKALLSSKKFSSVIIEKILDPDYPLILGVMEGVIAGAENTMEAKLVAEVVREYRKYLLNSKGNTIYPKTSLGDKEFWREGLFIVSPHHKQVNRIKKELSNIGLNKPFFVDTVDKMQGQETKVGIISYGVSDPEQATLEGEFIYSLNRLNVAMTRAQAKTIIFLPRPLLSPTLEVLENEDAIEGINFMLNLKRFMEEKAEQTKYDLDKKIGVDLTLYRYQIN